MDSYNSMNPTQLRVHSGVGTNLKVGGHQSGAKGRKIFFGRATQLLLALKVQLVVLVSAFVMVSTIWSVFCLLFFYSRCPACPAICKRGGGGHVPSCDPWSQRHCVYRTQKAAVVLLPLTTLGQKSTRADSTAPD